MNKENTRKWIATLLITLLTVLGLGQTMVHAVENPAPADHLTDVIITKVETNDKAKDMTLEQLRDGVDVTSYFTDGKVLPGVSFTWYSVTDEQLATMEAAPANYDTVAKVDAVVGKGSGTATAETGANGQVTIPNLAEGNYWVVENKKGTIESSRAVPFGLTLPFTNKEGTGWLKEIHVYPKNTLEKLPDNPVKVVDKENVAIGEEHTWTISMNIPKGIENYAKFDFIDEIDSRLDFVEGSVSVIVAEVDLILGEDYTIVFDDTPGQTGKYEKLLGKSLTGTLNVSFKENGLKKLKGADTVEIKFKTTINETAIMGQDIYNNIVVDYDNGHGKDEKVQPTTPPSVHTGGKAFIKLDGKTENVLEGAEFVIKNAAGKFLNITNGLRTFGDENNATIFTSDAGGNLEVIGLPYGDYVLVETKAPMGYALPTNPNTNFTVSATSYYEYPDKVKSYEQPSAKVQYVMNRKMTIPQTGGMGTLLFTMIGAVMMIFSAAFYRKTKKA